MKAAVGWVLVLGAACFAHREFPHRRLVAVIRHIFDDCEARAAVRAVDEGIAIAAILRVKQLFEAIITGRNVRRDRDELLAGSVALDDAEVVVVCRRQVIKAFDRFDHR